VKTKEPVDFGSEIAKIAPIMLREVTRRHRHIFEKQNVSSIVILDLLREKGPCKMKEVSAVLNLTMGAVTGIVDRMIKEGLVKRERSRDDRRVVNIMLLRKGKKIADKIKEARRNISNDIYSVLTAGEKKEFLRLLRKVFDDIGKKQ
jgi:DNA-binding MarR family transcriptional regulator